MNPLISVVTPVYNGERFLRDNVESWMKQTYFQFEVIYVDDGSTDNSKNIIESYIEKDQRFKWITSQHTGIAGTLSKGMVHAKSRYIVFMDQDDVAMPNRLEAIVNAFHHGAELIMSNYDIVDVNLQTMNKTIQIPEFINAQNILLEELKRNYFLGSAMAFYYKEDFDFHPNSQGVTDYDLALKMLLRDYKFVYLRESLIKYRLHGENTSSQYSKMNRDARIIFSQYEPHTLVTQLREKGFSTDVVYLSVGIAQLFIGKTELAYSLLTKVKDALLLNNRRERIEYLFYLGVCEYKLGYLEKALYFFEELIKITDNPAVLNNLGVLLVSKNNDKNAYYLFEKAYALNQDYQDASYNMKLIQCKLKSGLKFTERILRDVLTYPVNLLK